jgi:C-terminal processing protease CtpA/Prc
MSGLAIVAKGNNLRTFEVVGVQKGTPGHDAGIQVGDVISGIDDEPAADYTLTELRAAFEKTGNETAGHSYKLLVERNGQTLTLKMKMRRLI